MNKKYLFLIRNKEEWDSVNKLVKKNKFKDFIQLTISDEAPYLINTLTDFKNVMLWENVGVSDLHLNRYWIDNYKQIESIIIKIMKEDEQEYNNATLTKHFIFGLVQRLGNDFYKYIVLLDKYFKENIFKVIYFNPKDDVLSNILLSFCKLHRFKNKIINI